MLSMSNTIIKILGYKAMNKGHCISKFSNIYGGIYHGGDDSCPFYIRLLTAQIRHTQLLEYSVNV